MANTPSPALSAAARSFIDALPFWAASASYTRQKLMFCLGKFRAVAGLGQIVGALVVV